MSSSQNQSHVSYRPMWWLYGTSIALFVVGEFILSVNLSSNAVPSSWLAKVGLLLVALSVFAFLTIPGTLVTIGHPWGTAFRLQVEEGHYAHPRLHGLARMWAGLVLSGSMAANLFVPLFTSTPYWVLVLYLFALAPVLALYLFDRRH